MAMIPGQVTQLEFLDDSRQRKIVRWTAAVVYQAQPQIGPQGMQFINPHVQSEPTWYVRNADGTGEHGPHHSVTYLGRDGRFYKTKLHVSNAGVVHVNMEFENELRDGGHHDYDRHGFGIVDWDGHNWEVHLEESYRIGDIPFFTIYRTP